MQRCESTFKGCNPSAFYNGCSGDHVSWNKAAELVAAFTLAASPCVDMSDADNQIHIHKAGASVSCSCPSDIHSRHLFLPTLSKSWNNGKSYYGTSHPSPWWVSHCHRLRRSLIPLYFLPEFIGELKDELKRPLVVKYSDKTDSPLQSLEQKLENSIGIKQHLKLTQSGL